MLAPLPTSTAPKPKRRKKLDLAPIQPLLDAIQAAWDPAQIWLFGSRARGTATPQSDWDLLVVVSDELAPSLEADPLLVWRVQRQVRVRADLIPCGQSDFVIASEIPNLLAYEAKHHGVLIYGHA